MTCEKLPDGDTKMLIEKSSDVAYLLLNAEDANKQKDGRHDPRAEKVDIEYFIRPFDSYDNTDKEGYGVRGGQDLVLIKLTRRTEYQAACLPSNTFQDTNLGRVVLSGYGKYHRADCQTDGRGPMKFHYCQSDPDCVDHNCRPHFSDGIKEHRDCVREEKTPAKWSRLCSRWLHDTKFQFQDGVDEVHLLELRRTKKTGRFLETCYRQQAGEFGWCRTFGNFYKFSNDSVYGETRISTDWGWGFCSEECRQDLYKAERGVLRSLDTADILSEEYCERFLDNLRPDGEEFQFRPEALCVGRNHSLRYKVFSTEDSEDREKGKDWTELDSGFLKENSEIIPEIYRRNMVDIDQDNVYVTSAGSCSGDSGGPVAVRRGERWVVLGLVSGGRSNIKQCGGVNNPTVYVRLKTLSSWILRHVKTNQLCFQ